MFVYLLRIFYELRTITSTKCVQIYVHATGYKITYKTMYKYVRVCLGKLNTYKYVDGKAVIV